MADRSPKMISLGFGKWARADRIYALDLAERLVAAVEEGRVDLGRRARRVLEQTARPTEAEYLL